MNFRFTIVLFSSFVLAASLAPRSDLMRRNKEHTDSVFSFTCKEPQKRLMLTTELPVDTPLPPDQLYHPEVTVLHRCDRHVGRCFPSSQFGCGPAKEEEVELVFAVHSVMADNGRKSPQYRIIKVLNHTILFSSFAKFGDPKSDGTRITLANSDKWMKQAGVIDGKTITTTDTGICFSKFKSKTLNQQEFVNYVQQLAKDKQKNVEELIAKLVSAAVPGAAKGTTEAVKSGVIDRLTDTSKYTESHKERFDAEGKSKGHEGR